MIITNVGELKKIISELPDEMLILSFHEGMEKWGYLNQTYVKIEPMKEITKNTRDAFDGTPYSYTAFTQDKDEGKDCLLLNN